MNEPNSSAMSQGVFPQQQLVGYEKKSHSTSFNQATSESDEVKKAAF